jgi:hypothetical protein
MGPHPTHHCPHCRRDVQTVAPSAACPSCGRPLGRPAPSPTVMRGLGLALGDLWSVLKSGKTRPPKRRIARQRTEEEHRETPEGKVTLRRTVIEEIEIRPDQPPQ